MAGETSGFRRELNIWEALGISVARVLLILVVSVIILAPLLAGSAPDGRGVTATPFQVEPGTGTSALFLGVVFGFLSFAGSAVVLARPAIAGRAGERLTTDQGLAPTREPA